jgi:hypothetical protein
MEIRTAGDRTADGWNLWSAGHIENEIDLPAMGSYRISVRARAMSRTASRPEMEVRLDGDLVGSAMVDIGNYRRYTFVVEAGSGVHRVLVAFTNDPNTPEDDVDLIIDHVEIIATG